MKAKLVKSGPFKVDVKVGKHKLLFDEDKVIGGSGEGPAPANILLAAIGGCMLNTLSAWSQLLDISINGAEVTVKGVLDVRGMLGIDETVASGFQNIDVSITIDSEESEETIQKLIKQVEKSCPVYNSVVSPTSIKTKVKSKT